MTTEPTGPEADKQAAKDRIAAIAAAPSPWPWQPMTPRGKWTNYVAGTLPLGFAVEPSTSRCAARCATAGVARRFSSYPRTAVHPAPRRGLSRSSSIERGVGSAVATIHADGLILIETDSWATARYFDLGSISFAVDDELAEQIKRDAKRARPKAVRTENRDGIIVAAS